MAKNRANLNEGGDIVKDARGDLNEMLEDIGYGESGDVSPFVTDGTAGKNPRLDSDGNLTANKIIQKEVQPSTAYGLEWNENTDTYKRLGLARNLFFTGGYDGVKGSPFDILEPWASMGRTVRSGNTMVTIPNFWYKIEWETDAGGNKIRKFWVSPTSIAGYDEVPASEIGAYEAYNNGGTLESVSGVTPTATQTIGAFRTQAVTNGAGWSLASQQQIHAIQILMLVELGSFNTQAMIGNGNSDSAAYLLTGETDSYGDKSYGVVSDTESAMSYRGIENLWGNYWQFIDGFLAKDDNYYIESDYTNFNDAGTGYTALGIVPTQSDGYVAKLADTTDLFVGDGSSTGASISTQITDYLFAHDVGEENIALFGGRRDDGAQTGGFCWSLSNVASFSASIIGSRLAYYGS